MENILKYIQENGNFFHYVKDYDIEENVHFWEAYGSVIFNKKFYDAKIITMSKPSEDLPKYALASKLANKIIYTNGIKVCDDLLNKDYVVLHRGNCLDFKENSLDGLKYAVDYFDGFETDVRLTKDNHWIVYHDDNLKRLHNEDILIKDNSLDFFQKKYNIPSLKDLHFTNKYSNKLINIEIKEDFNKCTILGKLSLINLLVNFENKIIVSSYDWNWYYFIKGYKLKFAHIITTIDTLPKKYDMLIVSKEDYDLEKNIKVFGIFGISKKNNNVNLSIIDLKN